MNLPERTRAAEMHQRAERALQKGSQANVGSSSRGLGVLLAPRRSRGAGPAQGHTQQVLCACLLKDKAPNRHLETEHSEGGDARLRTRLPANQRNRTGAPFL